MEGNVKVKAQGGDAGQSDEPSPAVEPKAADQVKPDQQGGNAPTDAQETVAQPSTSKKSPEDVMKAEEAKLKNKYPDIKSGKSAFLQNRLAKKKAYFDSGEYNVLKSKESRSKKKISHAPVILKDGSGTGSSAEEDPEESLDFVPSSLGPAPMSMPTPEDLILRRASLHMSMSNPLPEQLMMRRATVQAQRMMSTGAEANPLEILGDLPALSPDHISTRKMSNIPSKLAMDG